MNMRFIDLHCDTITKKNSIPLSAWDGHITPAKLKSGGALAQCFALYLKTPEPSARTAEDEAPHALFDRFYASYRKELELNDSWLAPVLKAGDIEKNASSGKISSILTVEDCVGLEGSLARLDDWHDRGLRMAGLIWNYENELGYPNSRDEAIMSRGLKEFGKEAVRRMNELGIIVDVSHLSDGGVRDVAALSSKPFVASHSCARALCNHPRCLSDELLKVIGDCGGVIGLNFCSFFLREESEVTYIEDIVKHALYIRDKAGMDALALGSDFDGITSRLEFGDYAGMPQVAAALEKVFTPAQMDKICADNALRVMREVWG